jgi:ankyrin repeat protein
VIFEYKIKIKALILFSAVLLNGTHAYCDLTDLPPEMLDHILSFVEGDSNMCSAAGVCSTFKDLQFKRIEDRRKEVELHNQKILQRYSEYGKYAVIEAAKKRDLPGLKVLIKAGHNVNVEGTQQYCADDCETYSALKEAIQCGQIELVKLLLRNKVYVGLQNLLEAVSIGNLDILQLLLSDSRIKASKSIEKTLLEEAVRSGHLNIIRYLVEKPLVEKEDNTLVKEFGDTLLFQAFFNEHLTVVEYLEEQGAVLDDARLYQAARIGHMNIVKYLVEKGARVQVETTYLDLPANLLTGAVLGGNSEIIDLCLAHSIEVLPSTLLIAVQEGDVDLLTRLLDRGGDIEAKDAHGSTLLQHAALSGDLRLVQLLIQYGANVHATDQQGATALHKSVFGGNLQVLKLLIESNADVNARDHLDRRPIEILQESAKFIRGFLNLETVGNRYDFNPYGKGSRGSPPFSATNHEIAAEYLKPQKH